MLKKILILLLAFTMLPVYNISGAEEPMKGVWVGTVSSLDYPKEPTTDSTKLMQQADEILDNCKSLGFNAIFFQVRPASDAFYKSDIFPYSQWLTGSQGIAPDNGFDPLKYWVDGAHKRGMELHAWINPYRITNNGISLDNLASTNPARINKTYTIRYANGNYYYNPAMPEVRKLVLDGIMEIVNNYDVDGIHMDDYFYPGSDINDDADFEKYNTGFTNKDDWRRNNCDMLVKDISNALKGKDVVFGISPSGIWANKGDNPLGSDTNGFQSYSAIYADTRKWALEGWIDYIAPQIYWEIGHKVADYETLAAWWSETLAKCDTKLYIGIGEYRCDGVGSDSVWYNGNAIEKQLQLNKNYNKIDGEIHFRYKSIMNNTALQSIIKRHNGAVAAAVTETITEQTTNTITQATTQVTTNIVPITIEEPTIETTTIAPIEKNEIVVYLDGERLIFDQKPIIENGRTLVPMRVIFESLGMEVEWNSKNQRITATDDSGSLIIMTIGNKVMTVNGEINEMDVAPKIVSSRTLVPLRAISEACNANVDWDGTNRIITISTSD